SRVAILLTEGYNEDSVAAFQKEYPGSKAYTWMEYLDRGNSGEELHVFVYGLNAAQWRQLPAVHTIPHTNKEPGGIIAGNWPAQAISGQPFILQGTYDNVNQYPVQILLSSFGAVIDSVTIASGKRAPFTLECFPRQLGTALFELKSVLKRDTITVDPVPVQ